jgi:hypothetical protein
MVRADPGSRVQSPQMKTSPARLLTGLASVFCPTSGRTLFMGFHPLFRFNCRRRSGSLLRALAPHQAKPGLFSGGASSVNGTSCKQGFACRGSGLRLARLSGAKKSGLHRIDRELRTAQITPSHRAMGALENAADVAIFSLGIKTLRPIWRGVNTKPSSKYFVKLRCKRAGFRAFAGQFPFPPKALSGRPCGPRPVWI